MGMPKWVGYAGGEGLTKVVNTLLAKLLSSTHGSPSVLWASFAIGSVQGLGGLLGALKRREPLVPTWRAVFGSFVFGLSAFGMTILSLYAFTFEDADVGITTFIATLTVIPGIFIDRIFFGNRLIPLQWVSIAVFFLAGYAMLNFPPLHYFRTLPPWLLLYFGVALLGGLNEGITRALSRVAYPFANNFWIGTTTVLCSFAGIVLVGSWKGIELFRSALWYVPLLMGSVTLTMISFKLLTYKNGGTIALAKVVMFGTYLVGAVIFGVLFFSEPFTLGKIIGILGFFIAYSFADPSVFNGMRRKAFLQGQGA
ncbi:hypothetical protein A2761_03335 [Candidatus Kaiserbacteria bacterium RIFCSPHIGHO2_01_FULL_51_33]|uniref:EamA domain-containing protein n=1 Tax=Candidatus Kaiserbacteria bacterium RIFCSPLOWO2_01_FULL_51_21 TaxID=1798508 RepID=A0A1F6EE94_9BACT|nr:MAG: hypothetical protein A2761_03335 [Candidatus Kaiserbacteria bacterium RIFCSPHIGHO2_01_FULL_51_33]OGG71983.1 MAG: hypothetical protein A3A35_01165 [Candidatus Kaiserbacteria bacterium RIFCSPLOWO2_01_FULL_51_21]